MYGCEKRYVKTKIKIRDAEKAASKFLLSLPTTAGKKLPKLKIILLPS